MSDEGAGRGLILSDHIPAVRTRVLKPHGESIRRNRWLTFWEFVEAQEKKKVILQPSWRRFSRLRGKVASWSGSAI
jgi:hypothetical protein